MHTDTIIHKICMHAYIHTYIYTYIYTYVHRLISRHTSPPPIMRTAREITTTRPEIATSIGTAIV